MVSVKIGLTGGIGSGKSFVANLLKQRGIKVFDCDSMAKKLMTEDAVLVRKIREIVGDEAYFFGTDGSLRLNKALLAAFLFKNEENAEIINNVVHPSLARVFESWCEKNDDKVVVMEAAILFESGFDKLVNFTVMVFANKDIRIKRAMKRDGASRKQIVGRMKRQANQAELRKKADFVILNNGNENLLSQIDLIFNNFIK